MCIETPLVTLNMICPGQTAFVKELLSTGSMRRRLLDIGLIHDTEVVCLGRSPSGDPSAYLIRGAVIAIRSEDCENILVNVDSESCQEDNSPSPAEVKEELLWD